MISSRVVRAIAYCLLIGCAGARPATKGSGQVSSDAPSWARDGDEKSDEGSLFVCEGAGPDEAQAVDSARALCSAKICELCGVEVKSVVETSETLEKVDVQRKVVETCRRVRKGDEQVRYRQAGCGPNGCTAWLQVFFSAEQEARECRAYAEENFADSGQCEQLIEQFRATPDLTAASFRVRADLLSRAIIACADIDVRPTPKLTALDEILWQGVLSPRAVPRERRPVDKSQPIAERLRTMTANGTDAWKTDFADRAYKPIDRQPLKEAKIFVDRITLIRDAMLGYVTIMAALEALVDQAQSPDATHDAALVRALKGVKPVAGVWEPDRILGWAADELSRNKPALRQPALKAYLMEVYPTSSVDAVGYTLLRAMLSDERADDDEWRYVMGLMRCPRCAASLLDLPEHGGDKLRIARVVELSRSATAKDMQGVNPELLLRAEPSLDAAVAAQIFTYEWVRPWLERLPTQARDTTSQTLRDSFSSGSYDWRWTVSPAQHKALTARAWQQLQAKANTMRCDDLGKELSLLENHGADTRAIEPTLCRCVSEPRRDGMRDFTELYQRLVAWGASCVSVDARGSSAREPSKEGP